MVKMKATEATILVQVKIIIEPNQTPANLAMVLTASKANLDLAVSRSYNPVLKQVISVEEIEVD